MKLKNITLVLAALGFASASLAGEEMKAKMAIALVDSDGHGEMRLELDSDDLGFDLHDMQEGENRSIVDDSGRTILVTREADGFKFDVDGKTIKLPLFGEEPHGAVWVSDGDVTDIDAHFVHNTNTATAHGLEGVMIISERPIDGATRQAIKSMLESAGHGSEIRFVDGNGPHDGPHAMKVIEERVEVTN